MGGYCKRAAEDVCHGCRAACQCMSCESGDKCNCSCRTLAVIGALITILAVLIALVSYRERRRFLLVWSSIYGAVALSMTGFTLLKGPDPHDYFGCSVPFSLWVGSLFVATLSCYTTQYIRDENAGQSWTPRAQERYVYDPEVRQYVPQTPSARMHDFHVTATD